MKQYPDNFFDLAVVDPPYGIDFNFNENGRYDKKRYKQTHRKTTLTTNGRYDARHGASG